MGVNIYFDIRLIIDAQMGYLNCSKKIVPSSFAGQLEICLFKCLYL